MVLVSNYSVWSHPFQSQSVGCCGPNCFETTRVSGVVLSRGNPTVLSNGRSFRFLEVYDSPHRYARMRMPPMYSVVNAFLGGGADEP